MVHYNQRVSTALKQIVRILIFYSRLFHRYKHKEVKRLIDLANIVFPVCANDEDAPGTEPISSVDELSRQLALNSSDNEPDEPDEPDEPEDDGNEPEQQQQVPPKQNQAWAHMRTQNKQLNDLVKKIANAAGIEYTNDIDLVSKLNDDAIGKLAVKQGVPKELLERMEQLERVNAVHEEEQARQNALSGFNRVGAEYDLTQEELLAFAGELDELGRNPFEKQVDVFEEYRKLHFDDIMQKQVQAAVAQALARDDKANTHSTTPKADKGTSNADDDAAKISTVSQLTAAFKDI